MNGLDLALIVAVAFLALALLAMRQRVMTLQEDFASLAGAIYQDLAYLDSDLGDFRSSAQVNFDVLRQNTNRHGKVLHDLIRLTLIDNGVAVFSGDEIVGMEP